jgi:riboflavin kinase/FMN adenylyltransferase
MVQAPPSILPQTYAGSASFSGRGPRAVLTIGNFDGVHLGHRHLIGAAQARAEAEGVPVCVYTFEPAPRVVLAPSQRPPRITDWLERIDLLGGAGVGHVVLERFGRAFAQHPPEWFVDEVIGRRIQPAAVVVGYDFRFGRARAGDVGLLRARLPGVDVLQVSAFEVDGLAVSSSRIRTLLLEGAVSAAAALLGRPFSLRGTVVPGDQRGRTIGFPTANLESDAELLPPSGVYAVRARVDGRGPWCPAVANLGTRPTFDGSRFLHEVHLLDTSIDLYGRELEVAFIERLRAEQRFSGPDALVVQIRADVLQARERLAAP